MKKFLLILFINFINIIFSQNIVPNYSFENCDVNAWLNSGLANTELWLKDGRFQQNNDSFPDDNIYEQLVIYWGFMDNWTVPNRRHFYCGFPGEDPVGTPDITYEPLTSDDGTNSEFARFFSGNFFSYTGAGDGEFVIVELEQEIVIGNTYFVEVFVSTDSDHDGQVGTLDLFHDKPEICGNDNGYITEQNYNLPFQNILTCNYPGYIEDSLGWVRYRAFFTANDNYKWLSLGSADEFYWDDVRIVTVENNLCRNNWYFDNTVFNYPLEVFQAGDFIKAGAGVDPETGQLDGPVTVLAGSHTIFTAGNSIYLEPGFEVQQGAIFETDTVPCKNLCPNVNQNLPDVNCISQPTQIGTDAYNNTYVQAIWSPADYLDNPYSLNPTFTPPSGSGEVTYAVVYYNTVCGTGGIGPVVDVVNVSYTNQPNVSPTITVSNLSYDNYILTATVNVNSVVNEVIMSYVNADGQNVNVTYTKGVDYTSNSFNITLNTATNNISCCQDVTINFTAKSFCNQTANANILWQKSNNFGFLEELPNNFTPDGDGINDYYCFHANACSYKFSVFHQWGNLLYEEEGRVDSDYICLNWQGQIGVSFPFSLVNDTSYLQDYYQVYTVIDLYDDCGNHEGRQRSMYVTNAGYIITNPNPDNPNVVTVTQQNGIININSDNNDVYTLVISNSLGQIIHNSTFSSRFELQLSNGIYYIAVLNSNQDVELKKKIVVVN